MFLYIFLKRKPIVSFLKSQECDNAEHMHLFLQNHFVNNQVYFVAMVEMK